MIDYAPPQLHLAFGVAQRAAAGAGTPARTGHGRRIRYARLVFYRRRVGSGSCASNWAPSDPRDAAAIHALTDGRRPACNYSRSTCARPQGRRLSGRAGGADARSFVSYFEREVVVRLAPDDLDMLVRMAICPSFCVAPCAHRCSGSRKPRSAPDWRGWRRTTFSWPKWAVPSASPGTGSIRCCARNAAGAAGAIA
ncbi:hypothetical protein ACU4GD_20625 [Cupriavidus basilensis]